MDIITVKAMYDGSSFQVLEPVDLIPNTEYLLTIEIKNPEKKEDA